MNGNADTRMATKDKKVDVSSTALYNSEAGVSLQRHAIPLPSKQNVNVGVQKRKSLSFSRKASFSLPAQSLKRRSSYDVNPAVLTKSPPLIPAPKSFIHRRLSSSSSKRKDKFHLPPSHYRLTSPSFTNTQQNELSDALRPSVPLILPPTPPLPVSHNITQVKDTSVSDSETDKPSFLELVNGTHTNQYSQTSPAIVSTSTPHSPSLPSYLSSLRTSPSSLPPPHFRFPSPPHSPPPPPSPTLLDEPASNSSTLVAGSTFSSPRAEDDTVRKKSVTPSEAMGCLDEAIAVHKLSSSSFADSVGHPDFSPVFNFNTISNEHLPGAFTPNSLSAAEPEDSTTEAEAKEFATRSVDVASLQHSGITTPANPQIVTSSSAKYTEWSDEVNSFEEDFGKTLHHPRHDVSSADHDGVAEPKVSDTFKEPHTRKQSLSPKKVVEVLKLQRDIKTVRQQIKPGIVGELANLFQNMGDEYDIASPSGAPLPTTEHSIQTRENFAKSDRQLSPKITIGNISNVSNTEVFSRAQDDDIYSRSQPSSSSEQAQLKSSLDAASVEDLGIKPGMDYLAASKEIFKRVIEHKSQSEANTVKKEIRENKLEIQDFCMEDNVVFPSVLTSSTPNKMEQKRTTSTENSKTYSYTNSVRTKPLKTDMKFHGNTVDFNTVPDETASLLKKSPISDNQEFSDQADLTILKAFEGAVQEPRNVSRVGGPMYAPNHVNDFNTDDMSHADYTSNTQEPLSTIIKEVSSDHDLTASEFELGANIRQHILMAVTHSQSPVAESATNGSRDDELDPITGNYDRNVVAVASPTKTRPLSHVISNWERLLATADTESTSGFMNINKGQPLTCVSDFNTLGDTPVAKTGSKSPIQTNQGSSRSRLSLSTQTVNKSQSNNDKDFDNTTSLTSGWKPMVETKLGISSNCDAGVTDGAAGLDISPVSTHNISYVSDESDGVIHRTTETAVYSINDKKGYNTEEEDDYGSQGIRDEPKGNSSLPESGVPTGSLVEDYLHKQTVDVSFRPPASSNHTLLAGEVKDEHRDTGGVDLNSKRFSDQVSDDLFMKFPESVNKTQNSDTNSDVGINGIESGNTVTSVKPHSDDFLSILDDITIQTDITSAFLRSSRRSGRFPADNHNNDDEQGNHLVEKHEDQAREHLSDTAMKSVDKRLLHESSATYDSSGKTFDEPPVEDMELDHSLPESTEITAATSFLSMRGQADLNEEIEQQHNAMSPRLSEPAEHDNVLTNDSDSTRSHRSSVSSMTWSQKGSTSGASKKTMFNSEFFSKSEVTLGRSHQTSPQADTMEKGTVNLTSHTSTVENTLHSYTTVDNLNEDGVTSESEWITPTEVPRLIPWSEYAERAQIPFISVSDNSKKEQGDTISHRSSISSTCSNGKQNNKSEGTAVTRDVFSKQQATISTVERRLSRNESLVTASKVIRSIPWEEYEEKLNTDVEQVEPVDIMKSSNSDVEHSHRDLLQQELVTSIGSVVSSQGPGDSLDGSSIRSDKEIYEEFDKKYSQDTQSGFSVRNGDYRDHASDSNNNTLSAPVTPTRENSNPMEFTSRPPHVFSNEAGEVARQKQDEIIKSKNKFQALKNVFEKQDFENRSKPAAGFPVKRDSFKLSANPSPPTRAVSRTRNDKNGGMSIEGNVSSQHETGVYVSRDIDHRGMGVPGAREKTGIEIERAQRRDSHSTDTSSGSAEGGLVDTRGTRATTKKSQQTGLAYEVQAEELVRHSLSRNSSVGSSSSSHFVNTAEHLSSHIQPVGGHFSTDEHRIGQPLTQSWTASVDSFGLDKNVELPRISDTSSITHTSTENGSLEIPTGSSEIIPSTESDNKQTDLIDAFLRSSVGFRKSGHNQTSLNGTQEIGKPPGHISLDKSVVRGNSQRGLFGQSREHDSDSDHESGIISVDHGINSVNLKTDTPRKSTGGHFEPNNFHSTNDEGQHSDKMTAVVGEVSSFSIHKKITREESFGVHSESSSTADSPRDNMSARHSQSVAPDMYLIADKKGDYYALQEVEDDAGGGRAVTDNTNLHVLEMSRTDGHSRATDSSATNHDHYPQDGGITDVYIDSSAVDDDKARELISAYLDAQELNRQQNNTATGVHTYHDSLTTQQLYSRKNYSEDVTQRGAIVADNTGESYADNSSRVPGTSEFVSTTKNGSIVVQQNGYSGVTGSATHVDNQAGSNSYISSSTQQHDSTANNVYMSTSSRFEQLNTSSGDQDSFTSSYHLTRLSSPQVPTLSSSVVDTGYGTRRAGDYSRSQSSDGYNHSVSQPGVIPFQTKPLTITTTTQAVVGEQVGMRIDYPPNGAPDAFISSSDEETNQKRYIVKNVQQKSSMKNSSAHESRSFSDSNSDTVFSPGRVTTQYNTIGTTRDIHQSRDFDTRNIRIINGSDSLSPRSVADEPVYRAYQSSAVHSLPRTSNDYNRNFTQENAFNSSLEDEHNLYKVHNLSTSVPDGLQYIGEHRGRSGKQSPRDAVTKKDYKTGRKQHHSPERIFKNAKLSLRKDDYDNDYYSDEENDSTQYRTVTKVYLNENKPRSRSQSPDTRYKVSTARTAQEKRQDLDETDSGYQEHRRFIVVGTSDSSENSHGVNAHSSPKLDRKRTKSFEEATITRTELVQPSRINKEPPSTKTHKTVIQLEVDESTTKDRSRSEDIDSQYKVNRARSVDDFHTESRSTLTTSNQEQGMWRTGRLRSRSSSDDEEVDRQQRAGMYATSPRLTTTSKQEDSGKLYVINNTLPRELSGALNHAGLYKSTIDINQSRPNTVQSVNDLLSHRLREDILDSHNYRTEKSMYFVREAAPQTTTNKSFRGHHSTDFAYPDSGTGTEVTSSDGENEVRQKFERVERIYEVRSQPQLPEHFHSMEDLSNDLRVLRGNILIKNRLNDTDHGNDDFDENVNLFDNSFHLGKDNPLFSSDPDILASLQREEQEAMASQVHQDITFETVDKIAHEYRQETQVQTKQAAPRKKQNLSQLLLSKLANVDSKDIRQTIDVEHHNEEIYGDIDFIHADGERKTSSNTRNFDSVNEKVELTLTQGKAYVIIKVIAERIVPTDYEFNVWRKSQAIVTRQIEIDLLANEQRRRLYKHVMASAGTAGSLEDGRRTHYYDSEVLSPQERQLSSMETLKLFSQILDVTEGQGDKDYTETHTRQEMGQLPAAGMDLLY